MKCSMPARKIINTGARPFSMKKVRKSFTAKTDPKAKLKDDLVADDYIMSQATKEYFDLETNIDDGQIIEYASTSNEVDEPLDSDPIQRGVLTDDTDN